MEANNVERQDIYNQLWSLLNDQDFFAAWGGDWFEEALDSCEGCLLGQYAENVAEWDEEGGSSDDFETEE